MGATDIAVKRISSFFLLALALLTAACGGGGGDQGPPKCTPLRTTTVAVGVPAHGTVTVGAPSRYSAPVTPGVKYSVAIIGLSDSAASLTTYADGCFGTAATTAAAGRSPQESIVTPNGATLWIAVGADPNSTSPVGYVLLIAPVPSAVNPQTESQSITEDVPAVGQVATRSTSSYSAGGLASGARYAISVTALTEDVVLHVYADGTYSLELDCTLRPNHTLFAPQECQLAAGAVAYFTVQSGPINRVGGRYEILVTRL
jgi:hypothetical protein